MTDNAPDSSASLAVPITTPGAVSLTQLRGIAAILGVDPARITGAPAAPYVPLTDEDRVAMRVQQQANRIALWSKTLPVEFANARLGELGPDQDPGGKVSGWLDRTDSLILVMQGTSSVGKTHAAYAVGAEAYGRGLRVGGWFAPDLNDAMRPGGDPDAYRLATTVDIAIIDDLGREKVAEWTVEQLTRILDARNRNRLRTIITTNLRYPEVVATYGHAVAERMTHTATPVNMTGPPRRLPVTW